MYWRSPEVKEHPFWSTSTTLLSWSITGVSGLLTLISRGQGDDKIITNNGRKVESGTILHFTGSRWESVYSSKTRNLF